MDSRVAAAVVQGGGGRGGRGRGGPGEQPGPQGVTRLAPHRVAFRFGVISDVQYADINDATNYTGTERRSYRRSLLGLRQSIDAWNGLAVVATQLTTRRSSSSSRSDKEGSHLEGGRVGEGGEVSEEECLDHPLHMRTGVSFVLQLGDLIDGQNSGTYSQGLEMEAPQTARAMEAVRREVARCLCQDWRNVMGNHELLNYPKDEAAREVLSVGEGSFHAQDEEHPAYYSFQPHIVHPHRQAALPTGQREHEHANNNTTLPSPRECTSSSDDDPASVLEAKARKGRGAGGEEQSGSAAADDDDDDDDAHQKHHHHNPVMGWRFVVLDSFDVGVIGREKDDPSYQEAARILNANNPNNVVDGDGSNWFKGLKGVQKRFVPYNGAVGKQQLEWLRNELAEAAAAGERVIVSSHVPLHPDSTDESALLWNFEEVLAELHSEVGRRCVVAVLAGHYHQGGRCVDDHGIPHITVEAPLTYGMAGDTDDSNWPFADVEVEHDITLPSGDVSVGHLRCFGNGALQSELIEVPVAVRANVARIAAAKLAASKLAARAHATTAASSASPSATRDSAAATAAETANVTL